MKFEKWEVEYLLWCHKELCTDMACGNASGLQDILIEERKVSCTECGRKWTPKTLPKTEEDFKNQYNTWMKNFPSSWHKSLEL